MQVCLCEGSCIGALVKLKGNIMSSATPKAHEQSPDLWAEHQNARIIEFLQERHWNM